MKANQDGSLGCTPASDPTAAVCNPHLAEPSAKVDAKGCAEVNGSTEQLTRRLQRGRRSCENSCRIFHDTCVEEALARFHRQPGGDCAESANLTERHVHKEGLATTRPNDEEIRAGKPITNQQ